MAETYKLENIRVVCKELKKPTLSQIRALVHCVLEYLSSHMISIRLASQRYPWLTNPV